MASTPTRSNERSDIWAAQARQLKNENSILRDRLNDLEKRFDILTVYVRTLREKEIIRLYYRTIAEAQMAEILSPNLHGPTHKP